MSIHMYRLVLSLLVFVLPVILKSATLEEAKALVQSKRVPEARVMLETLAAAKPGDADTRFELGRCQIATGRWEEGLASLEKAMELAPGRVDIKAEFGLGCLNYAGMKSSISYAKKGRKTLEEVVQLDPGHQDAHEALAAFFSSAPWLVGGDMAKAVKHAEALRKVNPGRGLALLIGLKRKGKDYDEAFALCDEALKTTPDDYGVLYEFGRVASNSGKRLDEGLRALERCLTLEPPKGAPGHAGVRYRLAVICTAKGDKAAAKAHADAGLKLAPKDHALEAALKKYTEGS